MKWRRESGSSDPAAGLSLGPHERPLAAARSADGSWVVGTDRSLHIPDVSTDGGSGHVVLGWERIDAATWHKDEGRLVVLTLPFESEGPVRYDIAMSEPGRLPELVRERVTSTILVNQHVSLVGHRGGRIIGRRAPGRDDVSWTVVYDEGIDAEDPGVADRLQDELSNLRGRLGV